MRLFEIAKFPSKAGKVELKLADVIVPKRDEAEILIPNMRYDVEFFRLKRGQQFMLTMPDHGHAQRVYFGGTDEQPFLTTLTPEAFEAFAAGGEEGFFDSLKPPVIKAHETALGTERT